MAQEPRTPQERALELLRATLATPSWLPNTEAKWLVWAIRCAIVLGLLVLIASAVDKTLWDWLDLLIVPLVLAVGGYLFTRSQNQATQRAAERRAQDDALQAYLDQMSDMLIPNKEMPSLYKAHPGDGLSSVARARTLTVLPRLDGDRKGCVVQFLYEAGLILSERPVLALSDANLHEASLVRARLFQADLSSADLRGADLRGVALQRANLTSSDFRRADLSASLEPFSDVGLENVFLVTPANLSGANLHGAIGITEKLLEQQAASLEGAIMPDGSKHP